MAGFPTQVQDTKLERSHLRAVSRLQAGSSKRLPGAAQRAPNLRVVATTPGTRARLPLTDSSPAPCPHCSAVGSLSGRWGRMGRARAKAGLQLLKVLLLQPSAPSQATSSRQTPSASRGSPCPPECPGEARRTVRSGTGRSHDIDRAEVEKLKSLFCIRFFRPPLEQEHQLPACVQRKP
jgi:hypothetical protein